jgi:hypothetical protein
MVMMVSSEVSGGGDCAGDERDTCPQWSATTHALRVRHARKQRNYGLRRTLVGVTPKQIAVFLAILAPFVGAWVWALASLWNSVDLNSSSTASLAYLWIPFWGLVGLPIVCVPAAGFYAIWAWWTERREALRGTPV